MSSLQNQVVMTLLVMKFALWVFSGYMSFLQCFFAAEDILHSLKEKSALK